MTREGVTAMVCWSNDVADPDVLLQRKVEQNIAALRRQSLECVQVDADHGMVTLTGRVASYYERQLALTACQEVKGVVDVVDLVVVE